MVYVPAHNYDVNCMRGLLMNTKQITKVEKATINFNAMCWYNIKFN